MFQLNYGGQIQWTRRIAELYEKTNDLTDEIYLIYTFVPISNDKTSKFN